MEGEGSIVRRDSDLSRRKDTHSSPQNFPRPYQNEEFPHISRQESFTPSGIKRGGSDLSIPDSVAVAVMGLTGSGKSTFISLVADQPVEVGHSLTSSTVDIGMYSFRSKSRQTVYLVDTPGFDDTMRSDVEIFKDVAFFFASLYEKNIGLAGIIYLHRITDARMSGTAMKNLRIFQKMCGEANFGNVILTTTMWSNLESFGESRRLGYQREEELKHPKFWGSMIRQMKHDGSKESARGIVSALVDQNVNIVLDIQRQMVDQRRTLDDTDAGQVVYEELLKAKKRVQIEIDELKKTIEEAEMDRDEETFRQLQQEKETAERLASGHDKDWKDLNITMQELSAEKMPEYRNLARRLESQDQRSVASAGPSDSQKRVQQLEDELRERERLHAESITRLQDDAETAMLALKKIEDEKEALRKRLHRERRRAEMEARNPVTTLVIKISELVFGRDEEPTMYMTRRRESARSTDWSHHR